MAKKEKSSLVLPYDFEAVFEYLSVEQAGRLIRAIYAYERRDEEPDFSDDALLDITWKTNVKLKVDHNKQRYQEVVEARRQAGKQGGRPRNDENQTKPKKANGFLENQTKPKKADNDCDCDCEYECDKDIPSNIQTTSCKDIGTYPQQPVDNSDNVGNAEPDPENDRPASLDGMDLYLMESPAAFNLFRTEYPRRQGALRDVQVAWVTAVAGGAAPGDLVMAARKYAAECKTEKTEQKYIAMPQNFLKDKWRTYIPKYSPGCTKCHGKGVYEDGDRMVMCSCDRRYG